MMFTRKWLLRAGWIGFVLLLYAGFTLYLRRLGYQSAGTELMLGICWLAIIALGEYVMRRRS